MQRLGLWYTMQFELYEKVMFCCCLFLDIYVGVGWEPTLSD